MNPSTQTQAKTKGYQNGGGRNLAAAKSQPGTALSSVAKRMETNPFLMSDEQWKRGEQLAERAVKSGTLPKGIDTPAKAFIIILKGAELGLQPMYALEH